MSNATISYLFSDVYPTGELAYYQLAEDATMGADIIDALKLEGAGDYGEKVFVFSADMQHAYTAFTAEDENGWDYLTGKWCELFPAVAYYSPRDRWSRLFDSVALTLYMLFGMPAELASEVAGDDLIDVDADALISAYYSGTVEWMTDEDDIREAEADGLTVLRYHDGALVWY